MRHKTPNQDHLHIRGEYTYQQSGEAHFEGSPPHTWRIPWLENLGNQQVRITSTYVENTAGCQSLLTFHEDHLHIRGEYTLQCFRKMLGKGSPPHTWRIQIHIVTVVSLVGITSTYVENTIVLQQLNYWLQDHLHIRGEYLIGYANAKPTLGSPPHTWRIPIG
ncbi:hypothetical protein HYQ49_2563 [Lactobacillus crispatus]|nr:hypothetical protein [Lactobacillus crispatus]MBI1718148.1 hypothetical protein [Lactobacillus crispatus]